jgi:Uma2 family endonuclease
MAVRRPKSSDESGAVAALQDGARMTRRKFHRLYEQTPPEFKAELLGGTVYVSEPAKNPHGEADNCLGTILGVYRFRTPGVVAAGNGTVLLSKEDEVQPDSYLRIEPRRGGQSHNTYDDYVDGAPELVAEVSQTSRGKDLGIKRERYCKGGVIEYIVYCVSESVALRWFDLKKGQEITAGDDGILRSGVFPGLWIHRDALIQSDFATVLDVLNQGLASKGHKEFVARLAQQQQ